MPDLNGVRFRRRHPSFHRAQKGLGGFPGRSRVEAASSPRPSRARQHGKMDERRACVRRTQLARISRSSCSSCAHFPQLQESPYTTRVACHTMRPPVPGLLLRFWPSIQLLAAVAHHCPLTASPTNPHAYPIAPHHRLFVYTLQFAGKDWRKISEVVQTRYV